MREEQGKEVAKQRSREGKKRNMQMAWRARLRLRGHRREQAGRDMM